MYNRIKNVRLAALPSVLLFSAQALAVPTNSQVILNTSNVIGGSGAYSFVNWDAGTFAATRIFDQQTGAISEPTAAAANYWLNSDNGPANAYIVVDLGRKVQLGELQLFNTHNRQFNDRGTGQFLIEGSNSVSFVDVNKDFDLSGPVTTIASGTLAPEIQANDPLNAQSFNVTEEQGFQYLRFTAQTVASGGAPCCGANNYGLNELRVFAAGTTDRIIGGDPGEGGDFEGRFKYAVNFTYASDPFTTATVGDAKFTRSNNTPGVTSNTPNEIVGTWVALNFGNTANDNALESMLSTIRWSTPGQGDLSINLDDLKPGDTYKLQMMFAEGCCASREFDIFAEGALIGDNFNIATIAGGVGNAAGAALFTYEFTALDSQLNLLLRGLTPGTDVNPTISALTLENTSPIPEPATASLALLGMGGLMLRRRRIA